MKRRVFISSVMGNFSSERSAAKEAITRLRHHPLMAEDFGAQPFSSQTACMEGVRGSDIYIGIYGERYGYVAPSSGLAATEEEFHEARRRNIPILCFEKNGPKEPAQEEFLRKLKAYETGYAFAFFDTIDELKMLIVQALNDCIGMPGVSMLDSATAGTALDRIEWGSQRAGQYGTWLGGVLIPARQGETFIDVLDFGQKEVRERLIQPALFGIGALFTLEHGVSHREVGNALIFQQEVNRQGITRLEIHPNGTLIFGASLSRDSSGISIGHMYIISEDEVASRLIAFFNYATAFFNGIARNDLITTLYLGASLTGIDYKRFGKLPTQPLNRFSMSTHGLPDPLHVPQQPLQVSRTELSNPVNLARKMTDHIARLFRNAQAYFTPGDSH